MKYLYDSIVAMASSNGSDKLNFSFEVSGFFENYLKNEFSEIFKNEEYICFVDISELVRTRGSTGIQRVVKEFISRAITNEKIKIIIYNYVTKYFEIVSACELECFLNDIKNYQFCNTSSFDILKIDVKRKVFFDIDSYWNAQLKRTELYPLLSLSNFFIINYIYDLIPVIKPDVFMAQTVNDFCICLSAIMKYSNFVMFDSCSAESDFLKIKYLIALERTIKTAVVYLGNDFGKVSQNTISEEFNNILNEKFILFVGTFEPRKRQDIMLEAFDTLSRKFNDLHLVFIGKKGWKVEKIIETLSSHSLIDKKVHWLQAVDDATLDKFYKKCFMTVYLSDYEGYGLPVAESLKYGNITITSDNSSLREAGGEFALYVKEQNSTSLTKLISHCIENIQNIESKKTDIKNNFKKNLWDDFFSKIWQILQEN